MPISGSRLGERSIWYDEHSITCARPGAGGASERIAVPMLPPSSVSWPALSSKCATSAVVVDLPLVPVMATNTESGAMRRRSRQKSSMSPITSTPAARARPTVQCGAGWVSGTPGASSSAAILDQSTSRRLAVGMPAAPACAMRASLSSQPITSAPPANSALALARPEAPSPNTATLRPAKVVTGIMAAPSPQLQRRQAGQRQHDRDDPEADDDLRLGPAELLEMVMQRRHLEHALAGEPEREHLHDHRHRLEHEQAADDGERDLVLGGDRDRADQAAERERAGVAHEDRGGRRVEPEEAQPRPDHRPAKHRELAGTGDEMDLQIVGVDRVAGEVRDEPEARRRDH